MNTTTAPSTAESFWIWFLKTVDDVAGLPLAFVYLTWLGCHGLGELGCVVASIKSGVPLAHDAGRGARHRVPKRHYGV